MGAAGGQLFPQQAPVEVERPLPALEVGIERLAESSRPHLHRVPRSCHLGLRGVRAKTGARARRQTQNADESFRIFLVVAVAHGEGREIGAVKRILGLAADHRHVALVERERGRAGDVLLRVVDECVERFAQRREPQAEIDQLGILQPNVLLEVHEVALQAQGFEFAVRGNQQSSARSFVAAARLDADKAVLHQVDAADGIASADFVQQLDQRNRIELHAVHRNRNSLFKADHDLLFAVGSFLRRTGQLPGAGREARCRRLPVPRPRG